MSKDTKYISAVDTAKLVRKALKVAFPGIKFSVRTKTYTGGASITVTWTDGPTQDDVKKVTNRFEGGYFDGMTDYAGGHTHEFQGEQVHFGADYIFENRRFSKEFLEANFEEVKAQYAGIDTMPDLYQSYRGDYSYERDDTYIPEQHEELSTFLTGKAHERGKQIPKAIPVTKIIHTY